MDTTIEIKDRLIKAGIKPSLQRMAVMSYLVGHPTHPTVDTIYAALYPSIPTLSKTTVYNTLKLLDEQGAIQSVTIDEKNLRFDADMTAHAHFRCKRCGKIEDWFDAELLPIVSENAGGRQISSCQVYYKGYCTDCQKEMNYK